MPVEALVALVEELVLQLVSQLALQDHLQLHNELCEANRKDELPLIEHKTHEL
jgi:hypothetical protein